MKAALVSCVAPGHAAFTAPKAAHGRRVAKQQRLQLTRVTAAAVEDTETVSSTGGSFDVAAAYEQFEALLEGQSFIYAEGDKV